MHEIDLAYMAGTFDGDGSVSIIRRKSKNGQNFEYFALAQMEKVSPVLPTFFYNTFGGQLIVNKPNVGKDGILRQGTYQWKSPKGEKCKEILLKLLPYLCQKKQQVQLVIDYINSNPFVRGNRLTAAQHKARDVFFNKLKIMRLKDTSNAKITEKKPVNNSEPFVLSYIAGLMDTDGSFSIKRENPKRGSKSPSHSPMIILSMVAVPSINFVRENCTEGSICVIAAKNARHKFAYRFTIGSLSQAISFIERILPFLKIKKESAVCLLEFCKMKNNSIKSHGKILSPAELQKRENYYMRLKELNNGVYKSSLIILKTLPGNAEGNKEQAGQQPCSLNAVSEKSLKGYAAL